MKFLFKLLTKLFVFDVGVKIIWNDDLCKVYKIEVFYLHVEYLAIRLVTR